MSIREATTQQVLDELEEHQVVFVEGAVGSGKSSMLHRLRERLHESALWVFADPDDLHVPYAALRHLIDTPAGAHADLLSTLAGHRNPVLLVDDFGYLDEPSRQLLLWALRRNHARAVIACHRVQAHPELIELAAETRCRHLKLGPLQSEQIRRLLAGIWHRDPVPWQVLTTRRFTAGNLLAVATLAEFVQANIARASGPETWQRHFLLPGQDNHHALRRYLQRLRAAHGSQLLQAAGLLAMISPCTLTQALSVIGGEQLQALQDAGLLSDPDANSRIGLVHGVLDLSLRIDLLERGELPGLAALVQRQAASFGYELPAAHVLWWKTCGVPIGGRELHDAARMALADGQPDIARLLLDEVPGAAGAWLRAEAHVLEGGVERARAEVRTALGLEDEDAALGAAEALVCLATGFWPEEARRCDGVSGLESLAAVAMAGVRGDYRQVLELVAAAPPEIAAVPGRLLASLAEVARAMLGQGARASLEPDAESGDHSAISSQGLADGRRVVQLLCGEWTQLVSENEAGQGVLAITDRSGFSRELNVLMDRVTGASLYPIEPGLPSPLGYLQLRELAHLVHRHDASPQRALNELRELWRRHEGTLPLGVRLLYRGWKLKLTHRAGARPSDEDLEALLRDATAATSPLAQLLALHARMRLGHAGPSASARLRAEQYGLQDWLPPVSERPGPDQRSLFGALSDREYEVATLAAAGQRNQHIAGELSLSVRTVETHLSNAYRKLGVSSRRELRKRFAPEDNGAS